MLRKIETKLGCIEPLEFFNDFLYYCGLLKFKILENIGYENIIKRHLLF